MQDGPHWGRRRGGARRDGPGPCGCCFSAPIGYARLEQALLGRALSPTWRGNPNRSRPPAGAKLEELGLELGT